MINKLKEKLQYAKENAHTYIPLTINEVEEILKEVNKIDTKSSMSKLPKEDDHLPR